MQWWPLDHIKATVAGPRSLFCFVALVLPATSLSLCYQSFRCPRSVNTPTPCKSVKLARYSESTTVVVAEPGEWNYYFIYNYFNFFLKTCGSFHLLVPTWMFNKAQWACRASKYQTLAGSAWRLRLLNVSKLWWKCRVDSNCIRQLLTAVSSFLGFLLKCFGILIVFFVIFFLNGWYFSVNEEADSESRTCGKILVFLSWVLVCLTMPFSLFICFKVSVANIFNLQISSKIFFLNTS